VGVDVGGSALILHLELFAGGVCQLVVDVRERGSFGPRIIPSDQMPQLRNGHLAKAQLHPHLSLWAFVGCNVQRSPGARLGGAKIRVISEWGALAVGEDLRGCWFDRLSLRGCACRTGTESSQGGDGVGTSSGPPSRSRLGIRGHRLERRQNEAATTWLFHTENKGLKTVRASVCGLSERVHPFATLCTPRRTGRWGGFGGPRDYYRVRTCGGDKTIRVQSHLQHCFYTLTILHNLYLPWLAPSPPSSCPQMASSSSSSPEISAAPTTIMADNSSNYASLDDALEDLSRYFPAPPSLPPPPHVDRPLLVDSSSTFPNQSSLP
jgi:hypothetical protein